MAGFNHSLVALAAAGTLAAGALAVSTQAQAQAPEEHNWSGYGAVESRLFLDTPAQDGQKRHNSSFTANIENYRDFFNGNARLVFNARLRKDSNDDQRDLADLREFYWWQYVESFAGLENFELTLGNRQIYWGVAETRHLVDIINQTDNTANIDGEDKLGQPMISLLFERDWGTLETFALLGSRQRQFAGEESRLRPSLLVDEDRRTYQSSAGPNRLDWALRYSHVLGDWDLGLSYFNGTQRSPELRLAQDTHQLVPHYRLIEQLGVDLQATKDSWLWKFEAVVGQTKGGEVNGEYQQHQGYSALVAGVEQTQYGIFDSVADLGLLVEYQFDDRDNQTANNDLALGIRLAFNDVASTELLAALSVDLDNQSQFISVEAIHRINNHWLVEAELRAFTNVASDDPSISLAEDDYGQVTFTRYF